MPKARCPMLKKGKGQPVISDLPEYCWENCERAWDKAVRTMKFDGDYDIYVEEPKDEECQHINLQFSHDALVAITQKKRQYVLVDECGDCGVEYGEQAYKFTCQEELD